MNDTTLAQLEDRDAFLRRHIGPTEAEQAEMARAIGYDSLDALIDATVLPPPSHRILQAEHREQPLRHTELRGRACIQPEQRAAEAGRQLPLLQLLLVHTPVLRAERAAKRNRQPKVV